MKVKVYIGYDQQRTVASQRDTLPKEKEKGTNKKIFINSQIFAVTNCIALGSMRCSGTDEMKRLVTHRFAHNVIQMSAFKFICINK